MVLQGCRGRVNAGREVRGCARRWTAPCQAHIHRNPPSVMSWIPAVDRTDHTANQMNSLHTKLSVYLEHAHLEPNHFFPSQILHVIKCLFRAGTELPRHTSSPDIARRRVQPER